MTIAFFANFINHHTVGVMDELYKLCNGDFWFISTVNIPGSYVRTGYPIIERPYIIKTYEGDGYDKALTLAITADVCVFGGAENVQVFRDRRLKQGLLSFECGERWLKKGIVNFLSPRLILSQIRYHTRYYKKPYYHLSKSAFASADYKLMHSFIGKCYKWGYFTEVKPIELESKKFSSNRIMWVNRMINWKHPELPILMAKKLRDVGKEFSLDMYGSGYLLPKMKELVSKYGLSEYISFHGNIPNSKIIEEMQAHDIVLSTSDQNEGWGATINEGMSSGCVVVGSHLIGAVPYLIQDGINGIVFKSGSVDSLVSKMMAVLDHPDYCKQLAVQAYDTISELWSPQNAAKCFIQLISQIRKGENTSITVGPCSEAQIIKNNYIK